MIPGKASPPTGFSLFDYARAVKGSELPPVQRHLLHVMALAPGKGSDGVVSGAEFSYPRLADSTGYSYSTVLRAMRANEAAGWLAKIPGGRGRRNSYRLVMPGLFNLADQPEAAIHNPCHSDSGSPPDPCQPARGTPVTVTGDSCHSDRTSFPLSPLEVPSIVTRLRARLRQAVPDLTPDDDDLSQLMKNLETQGVRNPVGYLHRCSPPDCRRLLTEAQGQRGTTVTLNPAKDEPAAPDCEHGTPGGTGRTSAGTLRCPQCRAAARLSASVPFVPSPDGRDRPGPFRTAESLSEPHLAAVIA